MIPADRLHTVRYEDLAADPHETLKRIMEFVKLPYQASQGDVDQYSRTSSMRKRDVHQNLAKPINSRSVGRWREELSSEENREFCAIAGSTLRKYEYVVEYPASNGPKGTDDGI